jgi:serine/threonine protein kinase
MGAERMDSLTGAHLGKEYWVVDRIGDGGMGVVYLVEHRGLKKQFAAKILSRELTENAEARARFEIEARAASQLDHENIVNVTDYGVAVDGRPFLVMELLRGKTLFSRLAEGPLTLAEAVAVIFPVCAALGAAHEAGIVHRDIKPENVFLAQRPGGRFHIKVLDFGIAKASMDTPRVTKLGQVLGSPLYMAPEACRGEDVDGRADIYSLGVLLYQLTTNHLPFEDTNMLRLLQLHSSGTVPPPRTRNPQLPVAIEQVIMRALEKEREVRFQTVEELAEALIDALPEGADAVLRAPMLTPTPGRTPQPGRTGRTPVPVRTGQGTPHSQLAQTVTVPSGTIRVGSAAEHAMLEGGPTLMAAGPSQPVILGTPPAASSSAQIPMAGPTALTARPAKSKQIAALLIGVLIAGGATVAILWPKPGKPPAAVVPAPPMVAAPAPGPTPPRTETPPPPPATPKVHIRVTSRPSGAPVRLAGKELGATPLDVEVDSASGEAPLELRHKGEWRTLREVALDKDVDLDVSLESSGGKRPSRPSHTSTHTPTNPNPPPPQDLEIRGRR